MTKRSFEEALEKLDKITRELESGDINLESSLKKFEEGIKLVEFCNLKLDEAQTKVNILTKKGDQLLSVPFEGKREEP